MKKVLYGIFAISALAATSVYAAPVQVGEAAGSAATSASAGSSTAASTSAVSSAVGVALAATGGGDGSNTGITGVLIITTLRCGYFAPSEKSREATCNHPDLPAVAGVLSYHQRAGPLTVGQHVRHAGRASDR